MTLSAGVVTPFAVRGKPRHAVGYCIHQGLGNELIDRCGDVGKAIGDIECRERLGGLLRYYHRRAA